MKKVILSFAAFFCMGSVAVADQSAFVISGHTLKYKAKGKISREVGIPPLVPCCENWKVMAVCGSRVLLTQDDVKHNLFYFDASSTSMKSIRSVQIPEDFEGQDGRSGEWYNVRFSKDCQRFGGELSDWGKFWFDIQTWSYETTKEHGPREHGKGYKPSPSYDALSELEQKTIQKKLQQAKKAYSDQQYEKTMSITTEILDVAGAYPPARTLWVEASVANEKKHRQDLAESEKKQETQFIQARIKDYQSKIISEPIAKSEGFGPYRVGMTPDEVLKIRDCLFFHKWVVYQQYYFQNGICPKLSISGTPAAVSQFDFGSDTKLKAMTFQIPMNSQAIGELLRIPYDDPSPGMSKLPDFQLVNEKITESQKIPLNLTAKEIVQKLVEMYGFPVKSDFDKPFTSGNNVAKSDQNQAKIPSDVLNEQMARFDQLALGRTIARDGHSLVMEFVDKSSSVNISAQFGVTDSGIRRLSLMVNKIISEQEKNKPTPTPPPPKKECDFKSYKKSLMSRFWKITGCVEDASRLAMMAPSGGGNCTYNNIVTQNSAGGSSPIKCGPLNVDILSNGGDCMIYLCKDCQGCKAVQKATVSIPNGGMEAGFWTSGNCWVNLCAEGFYSPFPEVLSN